jgi:hypothetical protein
MSIFPSNYVATNQEDPAVPAKYFELKKLADGESTTIRLCGTGDSGHCIAGYQYFTMEGKPRRFPTFPKSYMDDIGLTYDAKKSGGTEKAVPTFFLAWACKRKEADDYQVFDITQLKVREAIEAILNIEDYTIENGEMANFYLTITRRGQKLDTKYDVTPVLKAASAAETKHWHARADHMWLPALFEGGDPFEGRPAGSKAPSQEPMTRRDELGADEEIAGGRELPAAGW